MDFKGRDGVLVVGGDKDDGRPVFWRQCPQDVKAADLWHLHVQKHQVRPLFSDERDRFGAVLAFAHDLQVLLLGEQFSNAAACQRLVIDNQGADTHKAPSTG